MINSQIRCDTLTAHLCTSQSNNYDGVIKLLSQVIHEIDIHSSGISNDLENHHSSTRIIEGDDPTPADGGGRVD